MQNRVFNSRNGLITVSDNPPTIVVRYFDETKLSLDLSQIVLRSSSSPRICIFQVIRDLISEANGKKFHFGRLYLLSVHKINNIIYELKVVDVTTQVEICLKFAFKEIYNLFDYLDEKLKEGNVSDGKIV